MAHKGTQPGRIFKTISMPKEFEGKWDHFLELCKNEPGAASGKIRNFIEAILAKQAKKHVDVDESESIDVSD